PLTTATLFPYTTLFRSAFGSRLLNILNDAGLALMISIGHRTGLFDTMSTLPAADAVTIAGVAGLNERYVREWLGAMTVGRIVDRSEEHTSELQSRENLV